MYKPSTFNFIVVPMLGLIGVLYAAYATEVMRPKGVVNEPLSPPPQHSFNRTIAAIGLIEAASENILIAPRTPGVLAEVYVKAGSRVRKGDPLFTLDDTDLSAELALDESAVGVARARLDKLKNSPRPEEVLVQRARVEQAWAAVCDAQRKLDLIDKAPPGGVSQDQRTARLGALEVATAHHGTALADLHLLTAGAWAADITIAEEELTRARAGVARTAADIRRLTTHAPIDSIILRSTARAGQYAAAGTAEPLMILGDVSVLHLRVDINETDAMKVRPGCVATACLRGDAGTTHSLTFVRAEPLITPKRTLTGDAPERVDTRTLQYIYTFAHAPDIAYVGQIADVYINTPQDQPPADTPSSLPHAR